MYKPKISDEKMKKLYIISGDLGIPVTKVLDMALNDFFNKFYKFREEDFKPLEIKGKKGVDKAS